MFKNFIATIKRFKLAGILNIAGLGVAFAVFIIIMMQVNYDRNFDRFHRNANRIFRIEPASEGYKQAILSRPLAEKFFESSPVIEAGAMMQGWKQKIFFYTDNANGMRNHYEEQIEIVSPEFTNVFTFSFAEGDSSVLKTPGQVMIPQSMAQKMFGSQSAIGKQLVENSVTMTVGAVYHDFPANTIVTNSIYRAIPDSENKNNWGNYSYAVFIRVNDAAHVPMLFDNFKRVFDIAQVWGEGNSWDDTGQRLNFTALPDIHFSTGVSYDMAPKTSRQTVSILFAIAIAVIIIAAINFTNFSTALTPMRIRNINTRKVLGASQRSLRMAIVAESVITSTVSLAVTMILIELFRISPLAKLVDGSLMLADHPFIVAATALAALLTGILAGLYPAFYMTAFAPALALKGSFGLSPKGKRLRNTLTGIQYVASFTLIIGAIFMYLQNRFMQHSSIGYDKDVLIVVDVSHIDASKDVLAAQLMQHAEIENVTYSQMLLSSNDQYMGWQRRYMDKDISFQCIPVHWSFLEVMGINVTDGRAFRREDTATQYGAYIFNETARKKYGMELNTYMESEQQGEIIGFINDVKFASFRTAVDPMCFMVWGKEVWGEFGGNSDKLLFNAYIRVKSGASYRAAIDNVRSTLAGFNADYQFNVRFYDDVLQQLYEKETALGTLISLFSIIAIFIAMAGVFGLVVFDSECRRKETGIRRVHGATIASILIMFNAVYLRIVAVCFVLSAPIAWYLVREWLSRFAYRTPVYWWVFPAAFAAVLVLTVAIVSIQNWKTASENPAKSIRTE